MSYSGVPLIRAAVCECFVSAARTLGAPLEAHARASRFPLAALEDPTALIPQIPAWRFIERVSQSEADALFGLRMNQALAANNIKTISPFLANSANAFELLKRFCDSVRLQTNVAHFSIEEAKDFVWMFTDQMEPSHGSDQVELFQLIGTVSALQLVLGPSWRPAAIDFRFVKPALEIAQSPDLNPSRHRFGRPRAGIAIPRAELSTPLQPTGQTTGSSISASDVHALPANLAVEVQTAIGAMLADRVPTVARIEDLTGMSLRTLQRRLQREGTNFGKLLERARLERAQELLTTTDMPVVEISRMLNYSHVANFSRSFKRWSAVSPKTYRQLWRSGP